jgi:hypothetical protein
MHDPLHRLYRTKLTLLAFILLVAGAVLMFLGDGALPALVREWPIEDIGSALFTTGLLGVALHYLDSADSEARDTERLRRILAESAPAMRDAVIHGFAFEPEDLARVSTPETLDQIITNGLGIRLGDPALAAEIYDGVRAQTVGIPERLHDARIAISLSMDSRTTKGRAPLFVATIRWEYDFRPAYSTRRFVAMSDIEEFRNLTDDTTATSAWYVGRRTGLDAASRKTFELVDFTINGEPRTIRRSSKQGSQTYSVSLGRDILASAERVHVTYTYRTLVAVDGHLLQIRVDQPTRGLAVELDYTDTGMDHVNVLDFISGRERTRVTRTPTTVTERLVAVEFSGWVFPRSGVAFVWGPGGHSGRRDDG